MITLIMGAIIGYALGHLIFWSCPPLQRLRDRLSGKDGS